VPGTYRAPHPTRHHGHGETISKPQHGTMSNHSTHTTRRTKSDDGSFNYVTQEQLDGFVSHVDQRFTLLGEAIHSQSQDIRDISKQIKDSGRPQYSVWVAGLGVLLAMAGMGAALVTNSITASQTLSDTRDRALQTQLEFMNNGNNRHTTEDQRHYEERVAMRFERVEAHVLRLAEYDRAQYGETTATRENLRALENRIEPKVLAALDELERKINRESKEP